MMSTTHVAPAGTPKISRADDEAQISGLLDDWAKAAMANDIDGIMSHYAPDVRAFDAILQLQFGGTDAYREHWQACLAMCPGPMIFEIHDLTVAVEGDLAFCHGLARCGAIQDGEEKTSWMRGTVGYRRVGGRWMIVHEHWSAPFDPKSGKALFDLVPEPTERASAA
jgi:ketosteroid isomerase-like protein